MKRLDQVLGHSFEQKEIVRAARVWKALKRWPEIVGEALAKKSWPDGYERGTIFVAVSGSAWAQELRMQKETILERVGEMLRDRGLATDVRFGVRELPAPDAEPSGVPRSRRVRAADLSFQELKERILKRAEDEA
ncbi:MAG TPA: DUF721 domain-containing protein [Fimbriimonadaceae bacterium]|mgnify:CR=1 FL=1|nr:DUF721 domain-containing protein [Fimbriimonadaceae bacterium]